MSDEVLFTGPRDDPRRYRVAAWTEGRAGAQGIVYDAVGPQGRVALKLLSAPNLDWPRTRDIADVLAAHPHPNIPTMIESFVGSALYPSAAFGREVIDYDVAYLVTEWVDGDDLPHAARFASIDQRFRWVQEISAAITHLHQDLPNAVVVHRDIKPANVRVALDRRALLLDFGLARRVQAGDVLTTGLGTPGWSAPEVLLQPDDVGVAADRWGLGALAYWSLLDKAPPLATQAHHRIELAAAARHLELPKPDETAEHIAAMLATEPDARPSDIAGWANRLVSLQRRRSRPKMFVGAVVAVGLVLVLLGVGIGSYNQRRLAEHQKRALGNFETTKAKGGGDPVELEDSESESTTSSVFVLGNTNSTTRAANNSTGTTTGRTATTNAAGEVTPTPTTTRATATTARTATTNANVVTPTTANAPPPTTAAPKPSTYSETTGGPTNTWTNYSNAGGTQGQTIPSGTTVKVSCKVTGFRVADGNTWWYRIASSPWNDNYYASADAFYNNGATSGSLSGTPFVDPAVPNC